MNDLPMSLPLMTAPQAELVPLINRARTILAGATTAAEVLDARNLAAATYGTAKAAGRFAKVMQSHDELVGAIFKVQADSLEIEAKANQRLADEYDAAQGRGEVAGSGQYQRAGVPHANGSLATAADLHLSRRDIFEARQIRDAEAADPGIIRRTLDGLLESGEEPTKAAVKRTIAPRRPMVVDDHLKGRDPDDFAAASQLLGWPRWIIETAEKLDFDRGLRGLDAAEFIALRANIARAKDWILRAESLLEEDPK